ncbi:DNA repair protein RadA [Trema orientale]|uniref:DNA repair protein RadA n=1 Tax=Trema orientale TaxID=63057 RepID=A0A2P5E6A2_TREOI|nr:DNA repair protein RadA [Trema orientale]
MKALRAISLHKHLLGPTNRRLASNPFHISSQSIQYPNFSRQFYRRFGSEAPSLSFEAPNGGKDSSPDGKSPKIWTVYDPLSGRMSTQKVGPGGGGGEEFEAETQKGLSGFEDGDEETSEQRTYGSVKKAKPGVTERVNFGDIVGYKKKTKKIKTCWVCSSCGYTDGQWWGMCRSCDAQGTMREFSEGDAIVGGGGSKINGSGVLEKAGTWLPKPEDQVLPMRLKDVKRGVSHPDWRISLPGLFGEEVGRVLGGGLVPGSLVLVGGDPGIGKSTLVLQIAALIAEGCDLGGAAPVLYVSGEESVEQIGSRADRMNIGTEELFLYPSTDIQDIVNKAQLMSPRALIIDSIQTVYLNDVTGSPGGLTQVKECTSALLRFAKKTNIPVLLIGHVTKSGEIAGPRALEHIVDAVLYLEGEKCSSHRLLRSVKNRFGSTDELGVFEMSQLGLQAVLNPSEMFLSEEYLGSDVLAGLAIAVTMDGSRSFLIEIQALCVPGGSTISRQVNGIQASRADMIISVLTKQAGLKLEGNSIFLNVVSGITLTETAGDLAVAVAICSSFLEFPIPNNIAFIGEIGLAGELRSVPRMDKRIHTVAKLGYKRCVIPKSAEKSLGVSAYEEMETVACKNLKEIINKVFLIR